jgi:two-component system OmpR family sensor kinase
VTTVADAAPPTTPPLDLDVPLPDETSSDDVGGGQRHNSMWSRLPLSRRLVIGTLAVMAATFLVFAGATYFALRAFAVSSIDTSLMQAKSHVYNDSGDRNSLSESVRQWQQAGSAVFVVSANGTAYQLGTGIPSETPTLLSAADAAELASVPSGRNAAPVTISLDTLGKSRAVAVAASIQQGPGSSAEPVTVVAATPYERTDVLTSRLLLIEAIAVLLALLVAGLVSTWFVRRSMRPLRDVTATAGAVAQLPLEHGDVAIPARVPNPVPSTEVGQVGLAVNAMLDHVESSLQTRADTEDRLRRFVSDAGHELRTPLAAVRGYAELMRRGAASDPDQARHAAERIESAGARMGTLVDDLLLLASLDEERPLARDLLDLHALVDEAVAEAATAGPDHEWSVEAPDTPIRVIGDGVRLHQAVANLLANARTHTPVGTSVTVTLRHDARTAVISVHDDGPGFPESLLPRVTERFTRGDASRARTTGGSGLGLAIVKAIAEAHGGTVSVANAPGGGGLVTLMLPAAEAMIPPAVAAEGSEPATLT